MAIKLAEYQATLSWDASKFKTGMEESDKQFSSFSSKLKSIGGGVVAGISGAITAASGAIVAFGKSSVSAGMDFDGAVSQIAATMGTTVDQIEDLRTTAQELGASTSFSATQAAEGLNILAMSGLTAEEQMAAIPDVLNLAAAGSIEMADAASYAVGAIKGFGDEFSNTQYYTDLMAKGATLAATDVNGLGAALSKSSSTAAAFGQKAEDTTVALLRLAEQNVTGEAASTALNRAMTDLYAPTEKTTGALKALGVSCYDSNGQAKEFNSVVDEINGKLSTMSEEEANAYKKMLFTTQGMQAFNMMTVSSTEKVEEFRNGLASASDGIGSAAQQAETMLDNLQGDITIFGSAVEGLQIGVSDSVNGLMRDCVQFGTEQIGILTDAVKENGLTGLAGAVGEVLANVITKIGEYIPQLLNLGVELIKSFLTGLSDNADKISEILVEIATTLVNGIIEILPQLVQTAIDIVVAIANALAEQLPTLIPVIVQGILNLVQTIINNLPTFLNAVLEVIKGIAKGIIDSLPVIIAALPEIIKGIVDFIVGAIPTIFEAVTQILTELLNYLPEIIDGLVAALVEGLPVIIEGIITIINGIVEALPDIITAIVEALPGIIESIINAVIELLPVLIEGLINLVMGIVEALPEIIKALIEALPQIITAVINGLVEALPQLITGLIDLVIQLVTHLPEIILGIIEALPDIIEAVITGLIDCLPQLIEGLVEMSIELVKHTPEIILAIIEAIPQIIESIIEAFGSIVGKMVELGGNMIKGLWDGICNLGSWLWDKISGFFSGIWDGICGFFGIHSPSRRFRDEIGKNLVLGLAEGINDEADTAISAMENVATDVFDTFSGIADDIDSVDFGNADITKDIKVNTRLDNPDLLNQLTSNIKFGGSYNIDGWDSALERFVSNSSMGYQSRNNTSIVINLGDIAVSGVLDKDADEQVKEIANNQIDDLLVAIAPLIPVY